MRRLFCLAVIIMFFCVSEIFLLETIRAEDEIETKIPLEVDYGIIKTIYISDTFTDEEGLLNLLYVPEKQYSCEITFDSEYEHIEVFVNGDLIIYVESILDNTSYTCLFSFVEDPSNVVFMASGVKKQEVNPIYEDTIDIENIKDELKQEILPIFKELENHQYTIELMQQQINSIEKKPYKDESNTKPTSENKEIINLVEDVNNLKEQVNALEKELNKSLKELEDKIDSLENEEKVQENKKFNSSSLLGFISVVFAMAYVIGELIKKH